ncbi:MAG: hypothetical protein Q7J27_06175 [Syntrophales bacterium]|nr:hypothetical protein [Syntrophales bacterium]
MREYKVRASNMGATYNVGRFIAESPWQACERAREKYRNSDLGQALRDVNAFNFFTVDNFPYEEEEHEACFS